MSTILTALALMAQAAFAVARAEDADWRGGAVARLTPGHVGPTEGASPRSAKPLFADSGLPPFGGLSLVRRVGASTNCPDPSIDLTPLAAGRVRMELRSTCRVGEDVQIRYANLHFFRPVSGDGKLEFVFECLGGRDERAQIIFLDGSVLTRSLFFQDADQVTKVAVIWRGAVNLDLHAFEYAAEVGQPGHVWAGAASSAAAAMSATSREQRSHGFMTSLANGRQRGDQLEVYTLWQAKGHPAAAAGIIAMALDYESRESIPQDPETCGFGVYSEVSYEIIMRGPSGTIKHSRGAFSPLKCGVRLHHASRYNTKSIPNLNVLK